MRQNVQAACCLVRMWNMVSCGQGRTKFEVISENDTKKSWNLEETYRRLKNTGYTQKNGAVSKVNKKFISHLTRTQRTPSATATVQVSHALPAVRFSYLLRGQFPRWRRRRKRLSMRSVLRCVKICDYSAAWVSCTV